MTVIMNNGISNAICAIVMLSLWRQSRRRYRGIGFWLGCL